MIWIKVAVSLGGVYRSTIDLAGVNSGLKASLHTGHIGQNGIIDRS